MGKELQPKTFKLNEDHVRKLAEIEDAFAPFTDGKSATVRFLIDTMHVLLFTKDTLQVIVEGLQGLLRTTSYYQAEFGIPTPAAPDAVGKGLAEVIEDDRKPRPQLISRRTVRSSAALAALGLAWLRSSCLHLRPSFAWRQA